jgi:hypothetical protein
MQEQLIAITGARLQALLKTAAVLQPTAAACPRAIFAYTVARAC